MASTEAGRMIDNPKLQSLWIKEEVNDDERVQLYYYLVSALRFREFIWRQHQLELLDEDTYTNYMKIIPWFLSTERNLRWWNSYKDNGFDPAFVTVVDKMLKSVPDRDVNSLFDSF
jgi:hypothetical protein